MSKVPGTETGRWRVVDWCVANIRGVLSSLALYQLRSEKGAANGYAGLDAGSKVPTVNLGGAGADATKYLRGDQSWQVPPSGAPSADTYLVRTYDAAIANSYAATDGNGVAIAWDAGAHTATFNISIPAQANGDILYFDGTWKRLGIGGAGTYLTPSGGLPSWGANPVTAHVALADPHTQYQLESEKGAANGYAPIDAGSLVPVANLGTGAPDGTKFLRDDRTWQVPAGGGGAPTTAQYLALAADGTLTQERILTMGAGILGVDSGAGAAYTIKQGYAGEAQGDLSVRGVAVWERLAIGAAGQALIVNPGATGYTFGAPAPAAHASEHEPGGGDAMAVDAAAGTGSLRTLGTGALQAAAGNHSHTGRIVQRSTVVGTTSGPTTTLTAYSLVPVVSLLPEMTMSFTPTSATNNLYLTFHGAFQQSTADRFVAVTLYIDGTAVTDIERLNTVCVANGHTAHTYSRYPIGTLSVAAHTIELHWRVQGGTGTAVGTRRIMTIEEEST